MDQIPIIMITVCLQKDMNISATSTTNGDDKLWTLFRALSGGGDRQRFEKEYNDLCEEYHIREFLKKAAEITARSLFGDALGAPKMIIDLSDAKKALRNGKEDKP